MQLRPESRFRAAVGKAVRIEQAKLPHELTGVSLRAIDAWSRQPVILFGSAVDQNPQISQWHSRRGFGVVIVRVGCRGQAMGRVVYECRGT